MNTRRPIEVAAVVFDMDGLMLDTESLYKASWQRVARELGCDLDDAFYLTLVGRKNSECEAALMARFGDGFPLAEFRARWSQAWKRQAEAAGIPLKPGLVEFLAFLDARRVPTAVATSSDEQFTDFSLQTAGLRGRFAAVVTGDKVAHGKPAPDIYLLAAECLGVEPSACVALEDSNNGVIAASRAGMVTVMVPDLQPPSTEAASAAWCVLESLGEARDLISRLLNAAGR